PVPEVDLPDPLRFTLTNGLDVVVIEKHQVPIVQLVLQVRAGSVRDEAGKVGLASLTADMIDEGAAGKSALELADAFEMLGARFAAGAGRHVVNVTLRVPVERLPDALAIMTDVVRQPDFPQAELERLRTERLTALIRQHDDPNTIAGVLFDETVYGGDHAYGRGTLGDEASLRSFTVDDVRAFHDHYYRPNNATLIVAGDIAPAEARRLAETAFGGWQRGEAPPASVAAMKPVTGRTIYLVDKPGAVQSVIRLGHEGVPRATPDYYAVQVLNTILGGSFTSRLNQNLREDKGYTYGAGSAFSYGLGAGSFAASAAVQTQSTGPALAEFMKELNGIRAPIPQEEVERARQNLAMGFIQDFQSVAQVAGQFGQIVEFGLPSGWLDDYVENVLAVTKQDVERVAQQYIDPENIAIVVVGDRATIEEQIRALDLGPIHVLTVTDVLGPVPKMERPTS
ncbi:MAG: M16 family metallopeptidase, partial [Longimicrobiales bacterium]